jgi:SAM-dependent methyltransferase
MGFRNTYDDRAYADAYARLEFPGTYYLAYRDLPAIIGAHVSGRRAVDFGCGTGRSTRFLRSLGFDAVGLDIAADMIGKVEILAGLRGLLAPDGRLVNLVSSPDIYTHEWASFSSQDFPENRDARPGDVVRCINNSIDDRRPAEDVLCPDETYREVYAAAGLDLVATYRPLARGDEPIAWVNETRIAPWVIYVMRASG